MLDSVAVVDLTKELSEGSRKRQPLTPVQSQKLFIKQSTNANWRLKGKWKPLATDKQAVKKYVEAPVFKNVLPDTTTEAREQKTVDVRNAWSFMAAWDNFKDLPPRNIVNADPLAHMFPCDFKVLRETGVVVPADTKEKVKASIKYDTDVLVKILVAMVGDGTVAPPVVVFKDKKMATDDVVAVKCDALSVGMSGNAPPGWIVRVKQRGSNPALMKWWVSTVVLPMIEQYRVPDAAAVLQMDGAQENFAVLSETEMANATKAKNIMVSTIRMYWKWLTHSCALYLVVERCWWLYKYPKSL